MKITVKARFNAKMERFEGFGANKYLLYLGLSEDEETPALMKEILSKKLGIPVNVISYLGKDVHNDFIFSLR